MTDQDFFWPLFVPKYRELKNDISGGTLPKFVISPVAGAFLCNFPALA